MSTPYPPPGGPRRPPPPGDGVARAGPPRRGGGGGGEWSESRPRRGTPSGVGLAVEVEPNRVEDSVELAEDLTVAETEHGKPALLQPGVPDPVGRFVVLLPVELYHESGLGAVEVEDVGSKRDLPAEAPSTEFPVAKPPPEESLSVGRVVSEVTSKGAF